jgi:hypothetical protein
MKLTYKRLIILLTVASLVVLYFLISALGG